MNTQPNLPDRCEDDPYWQAARTLLDPFDYRVWEHVTPHGIDFPAILDQGFSGGERRLLQAAASLWDGQQTVSLLDLTTGLDDPSWNRLVQALSVLRDGLR
jgi:hypothetical protein